MTAGYEKVTTYEFETEDGMRYGLSQLHPVDNSPPWCYIEELRKNGQEDTHMTGVLGLVNGKWAFLEESEYSFDEYGNGVDYILQHLNKHGHPEQESTAESR